MSQKHADYILLQVPQGSECWAKCALGFSQYRTEKKKILLLPEALSQAHPVLDPAPRPLLPLPEMQMSPGLQPALREWVSGLYQGASQMMSLMRRRERTKEGEGRTEGQVRVGWVQRVSDMLVLSMVLVKSPQVLKCVETHQVRCL